MKDIILIEKGELTDKGYKCIVLNNDNTKSQKIIPKAECELLMYLLILQGTLRQQQMTELKKLIQNFAEEKHLQSLKIVDYCQCETPRISAADNSICKKCKCKIAETFYRPTTVGDLLESLKKGIKCEVVASAVEFTNIKLDGWLKYEGCYETYLSKNIGWVIYEKV